MMTRRSTATLLRFLAFLVLVMGTAGLAPGRVSAGSPLSPLTSFFTADGNGYRLFSTAGSLAVQPDGMTLVVADGGELASLRLSFVGMNPLAEFVPENPLAGTFSDLRGDPSDWAGTQPVYAGLRWRGIQPGVDLVLRASSSAQGDFPAAWQLESTAGTPLENMTLRIEGAQTTQLEGNRLALTTSAGAFELSLPVPAGAARKARLSPVESGVFEVSFPFKTGLTGWLPRVFAQADSFQLLYASFLGGSSRDSAYALAVDSAGAVYLAGETPSADFPVTSNKVTQQAAQLDAFLVKLTPDGSQMDYAVLMGGGSLDSISTLAVENGIAYVAGDTWSQNFPAGTQTHGENDAWAAALTPDGSGFVYAVRFGGSDQDRAHGLAVKNGSVTLTGVTWSMDYPSSGFAGGGDVFVMRLNPRGQVTQSALFGGSDVDAGFGISVNGSGVAVCGQTWSRNFPMRGLKGEADAFVLLLDDQLSLRGGTVFGGALEDSASACAFAEDGTVYIAGRSDSSDFPADHGSLSGQGDAFVAQVDPSGNLESAVLLGGSAFDLASALGVAPDGSLWVGGRTDSSDFPSPSEGVEIGSLGGMDAFAVNYPPGNLSEPNRSVKLGGSGEDRVNALVVGPGGAVYLAGTTKSADFPISPDALYAEINGNEDAFIAWLGVPGSQLAPPPTVQPPVPTATEGPVLEMATEVVVTPPAIEPTEGGELEPAQTDSAGESPAGATPGVQSTAGGAGEPTVAASQQVEDRTPDNRTEPEQPAFPWTGLLLGLGGAAVVGAVLWIVIARNKRS